MNARLGLDQASDYLTTTKDGQPIRIWLEPPQPKADTTGRTELLASLLLPALECNAIGVAAALMVTFRSLSAVLNARRDRLATMPGMTDAAMRLIEIAHQIASSAAREEIGERVLIGSCDEFERFVRAKLRGKTIEAAYGLFLDRKNRLIDDVLLGEGTVDHTPLYAREVVRHAARLDASALILVHNHPSGDPTPSGADITKTRQIAAALTTIDVALHDCVIVGSNLTVSLRTLRLL